MPVAGWGFSCSFRPAGQQSPPQPVIELHPCRPSLDLPHRLQPILLAPRTTARRCRHHRCYRRAIALDRLTATSMLPGRRDYRRRRPAIERVVKVDGKLSQKVVLAAKECASIKHFVLVTALGTGKVSVEHL